MKLEEYVHDDLLREAASRLDRSLNKVSNPKTSAIAVGEKGKYYGNNIFLSNCTMSCAEQNAVASAVSAGDTRIQSVYLVASRDDKPSEVLTPCGNCRQILYDFSRLGEDIQVVCSNMKETLTTSAIELLPLGFNSNSLTRKR